MKLTNDSYVILIGTRNFTERYYRDKTGWLKVGARGRIFRMTAEQVLNHILPALAGIKLNLTIKVEHHEAVVPNADEHLQDVVGLPISLLRTEKMVHRPTPSPYFDCRTR